MTDFISVEKVYGILDAAITPISRKERLPLRDALGCVLAESLYATNDVPAFNNSAMDGFAFPGSSLPAHGLTRLPVEGVSYAGVPYCGEYSPRTALRVMTGAAVPEGADTVIPFEHVRETTDDAGQTWIEFPHDEVKPGTNLRLKGEEMKAGSIVMPAGLVLTPEWIGMAASLGHAELLVRRIRVAVFSTGDELAAPGTPGPLDTGRIYNANSPLIAALAQSWGAQAEDLGILPDNPEAIRNAFLDLGSRVDFIVTFVIDPAALCDLAWMKEEMDAMIDYVKASPQPNPENPVLMPGEIERIRTADREAHGVEISDGEWAAIIKTCRDAGVPESELQA